MYYVSSSPHVKSKITTQGIMLDVIIAMIPAAAFGVINNASMFGMQYGIRAALLIAVVVATCILTEFGYQTLTKRTVTTKDLSAVVTGMILALNLPVTLPFWMAILGGVFAILVVKQLFGGLGQNFMNPALGARCFLVLSFAGPMTAFFPKNSSTVDSVSSATPLTALKAGETPDLMTMFLGTHAGTIGETCVVALLAGGAYLLIKKIIDWRIPVVYIVTFTLCLAIFSGKGIDISFIARHLCGGGLVFGAFFMATDYTTSPITGKGKIIYGICLGIMTALLRVFGNTAEGVSFAIIFCNLLVPLIEKISIPKAFGLENEKGGR
ncbi:MAG: RnfABCDGE type electron transport complex subunit D [Lachnospiraceae bacterium]|nr:RnfABCDGE type electron transport complex subunit D [Lachnospiraceae bacterium]